MYKDIIKRVARQVISRKGPKEIKEYLDALGEGDQKYLKNILYTEGVIHTLRDNIKNKEDLKKFIDFLEFNFNEIKTINRFPNKPKK